MSGHPIHSQSTSTVRVVHLQPLIQELVSRYENLVVRIELTVKHKDTCTRLDEVQRRLALPGRFK